MANMANMATDGHTSGKITAHSVTVDGCTEAAKIIKDADGNEIARIDYRAMPTGSIGITLSDGNARRLCAAWNAFDKVPTEVIEDERALGAFADSIVAEALECAEAEVAELCGALQPFANFACPPDDDGPCGCFNCVARDLIAKHAAKAGEGE